MTRSNTRNKNKVQGWQDPQTWHERFRHIFVERKTQELKKCGSDVERYQNVKKLGDMLKATRNLNKKQISNNCHIKAANRVSNLSYIM